MALDYASLIADLRAESMLLTDRLTGLADQRWALLTPAEGWTIHDQVSHLAFFDNSACLALSDADKFREHADELMAAGMDFPDRIVAQHRSLTPESLLNWFTASRQHLLDDLAAEDPRRRLPWFRSRHERRLCGDGATHGDVGTRARHLRGPQPRPLADSRASRDRSSRRGDLRVLHRVHGLPVPDEPVRVELRSPEGELWTWGPPDAATRISGTATDFVLTVTQRRHWRETNLIAEGTTAAGWLDIAQAFAGPASRRDMPPEITSTAARWSSGADRGAS